MRVLLTVVGAGVLALTSSVPPALAASEDQVRAVAAAVEWLPSYVERALQETGVPGAAVAVVHDDRLVFARGFGVRHAQHGGAVTADTVFQIASLSKPLGATAVAASVGKGAVAWDTPATPLLPGFDLSDPWVSAHVTIGDLYSHRSGLPGGYGNDLESFGYGRQPILDRADLEPLGAFRDSYAYSNFGLTAGGVAAASASGRDWATFADDELLGPLGMTRSSFRFDSLSRWANVASLHQQVRGRWVPGPARNADAQAPAGGASSTVRDLSRWMRMVLAHGKFEGRRVVGRAALDQMLSLQNRFSTDPATRIEGYGFGIQPAAIANEPIAYSHNGEFTNGASTQVYLIPELDLGIVTLTNGWPKGVPQAINTAFVDQVRLGEQSADWLALYGSAYAPLTQPSDTLDGQARPKRPTPALPLEAYVGSYGNDYVGPASVTIQGGRLVVALGPDGMTRLPLSHWSGNVFTYNWLNMPPGFLRGVTFLTEGAAVTTMTLTEVNSDLGRLSRIAPTDR